LRVSLRSEKRQPLGKRSTHHAAVTRRSLLSSILLALEVVLQCTGSATWTAPLCSIKLQLTSSRRSDSLSDSLSGSVSHQSTGQTTRCTCQPTIPVVTKSRAPHMGAVSRFWLLRLMTDPRSLVAMEYLVLNVLFNRSPMCGITQQPSGFLPCAYQGLQIQSSSHHKYSPYSLCIITNCTPHLLSS